MGTVFTGVKYPNLTHQLYVIVETKITLLACMGGRYSILLIWQIQPCVNLVSECVCVCVGGGGGGGTFFIGCKVSPPYKWETGRSLQNTEGVVNLLPSLFAVVL